MAGQADAAKTARSDKAYDKWFRGIAEGVTRTEQYIAEIQEGRPTIVEVKIKCDPDDERGVLVILRGYQGAQEMVAFHREETYSAALTGVGNRLRNGSIKWKEAIPYEAK